MALVIEIIEDVSLDRPVMVVALAGWVDAGSAGEAAARYLAENLEEPVEMARVDLAEYADLQATRPMVELKEGVTREITWPAIRFIAGRAGSDVVVCHGPEPSLGWRALATETAEVVRLLGVRMVVTLGGMPTAVSHRRPIRVLATATSRSVAQEVDPVRLDYAGPTGAQTAIQIAAASVGVPGVGLWAQVPHYLSGTVSPVATRALLARLRDVAGIDVDLVPLDHEAETYQQHVDETVTSRSDLAELVETLDQQVNDLPTGDELASEIEEFLRRER